MRYLPETMTRAQLRKCYSRYALTMILYLVSIEGLALLLAWVARRYLGAYLADPFWYPVLQVGINDVAVYLPGLIWVPLLLGNIPRAEKLPVDRLMLGEMVQAILFSMGALYLFAGVTSVVVTAVEQVSGVETSNVVDEFSNLLPVWLVALTTVVVAPILEELIFRKLLLERLRGLGDVSAVLLSALAFSLFHLNLYQMLYAFVLGMVFACVVLVTGSVRDPILLHMIINGTSVLTSLEGPSFVWMLFEVFVVLSVLSFFFLLLMNWRKYQMEPGPLPFRSGEKLRACLSSVWFWLMLIGGVVLSVGMIFL